MTAIASTWNIKTCLAIILFENHVASPQLQAISKELVLLLRYPKRSPEKPPMIQLRFSVKSDHIDSRTDIAPTIISAHSPATRPRFRDKALSRQLGRQNPALNSPVLLPAPGDLALTISELTLISS